MGAKRSKTKSGLDYWLENCYRCSHFERTHYLMNGKDDGCVGYRCKLLNQCVTPYHMDGCKHFNYGKCTELNVEVKKAGADE